MPAPSLGLVGAGASQAIYSLLARKEAERLAAEQEAYKRTFEGRKQSEVERAALANEGLDTRRYELSAELGRGGLDVNRGHLDIAKAGEQRAGTLFTQGLTDRATALETINLLTDPAAQQAARIRMGSSVSFDPNDLRTPEQLGTRGGAQALAAWDVAGRKIEEDKQRLQKQYAPDPQQYGGVPLVMPSDKGMTIFDRVNNTGVLARWAAGQPNAGEVIGQPATAEMRNRAIRLPQAEKIISKITDLSKAINDQKGVMATIVGEARKQAAKVNLDNDVALYEAIVASFTPVLSRIYSAHTGVLTELDVQSAKKILPAPEDNQVLRDYKIAFINEMVESMKQGVGGTQSYGTEAVTPGVGVAPPTFNENVIELRRNSKGVLERVPPRPGGGGG
jgi:hypothetical protein